VRAWLFLFAIACAAPAASQDLDRDGIADHLEQALLEKFAPTLLLARGECDGVPASFVPNVLAPRVLARDATLYGQAFRVPSTGDRVLVELHFFHLWAKDCGRRGHDLDVEHVSAIVFAPGLESPASTWIADVWYAAAHQGSVCDASSGARASVIGAAVSGPRVFVSRGKHASYLDRGQCKGGCGGDECGDDRVVTPSRIINIGESDAPLNGSLWIHSDRWPMREKLASDFDPGLRARLDSSDDHVIPLMQHWRGPQAPVLAGDTALDGLELAGESARSALATARRAAGKFFRTPLRILR
jgi:hypothetical protein